MLLKIKNKNKKLKINKAELKKVCQNILNSENVEGNVSLIFVDKFEIKKIHQEFMQDDSETDVISFEYNQDNYIDNDSFIGDIFVSVDAAIEFTAKNKTEFSEELLRYVVHGILHCLGYDDLESKARTRMQKKQEKYVKAAALNIFEKLI